MPYVPSKKTDGKSDDREIIGGAIDPTTHKRVDGALEPLAQKAALKIKKNDDLVPVYVNIFGEVSEILVAFLEKVTPSVSGGEEYDFAKAIYDTGEKYGYDGAFLGELNYGFTMFIQRVPEIKVEKGKWKEELRYWLYARTDESLRIASQFTLMRGIGIGGVFGDILAEYKDKVNGAYEVAQIVKSGHCYFTPYYSRPVELVDENGGHVGFIDVMLKRTPETVFKDVLDGKIVLKTS